MTVWTASLIALWLLVIVLAFLLAGALRQLGLLQLRLGDDPGPLVTASGLDRGAVAPDFTALDVDSSYTVRLSDFRSRASVLVFVTPSCISCRELVPGINEVLKTRQGEFEWFVICNGDEESCTSFKRRNELEARTVIDQLGEIETSYQVQLTPFAYLLDHEHRVLIRGVVNDWRHLESLLDQEGTVQQAPWQIPGDESGAEVNAGVVNDGS